MLHHRIPPPSKSRLDLGNPQLTLPIATEDPPSFFDEVDPVRAHEREAKDGDVSFAVSEGEVCDIGDCDVFVWRKKVVGVDCEMEFFRRGNQGTREGGVAAAEVGDGAGEGFATGKRWGR